MLGFMEGQWEASGAAPPSRTSCNSGKALSVPSSAVTTAPVQLPSTWHMVSVTEELNFAFYGIVINLNRRTWWLVTAVLDSTAVANFLQETVMWARPEMERSTGGDELGH